MKTYANIFIGVLVTLVIVLGVAYFNTPKPTPPYGALPGPDISSPYLSVNGVPIFYARQGLYTATTTICAIQSPTSTSTLLSASIYLSTSSTTASRLTIAKSVTAFATTTLLGSQVSVSANLTGMAYASTTSFTSGVDTVEKFVFAPSNWVVFGMDGGGGTFSPAGRCQASWIAQ